MWAGMRGGQAAVRVAVKSFASGVDRGAATEICEGQGLDGDWTAGNGL